MAKERSIETLTLDGGTLCFNFINTVYAWRGENLHEYLPDYNTLIKWCNKVHLLPQKDLRLLQQQSLQYPERSMAIMVKIRQARDVLYHFFSAIAGKEDKLIKKHLPAFNKLLAEAMSNISFIVARHDLALAFSIKEIDMQQPLWMIIKSAYDVLTIDDAERIKECPKCGWVFLDQTKNGKRRWCNPLSCGAVDKMKRYYLRKKEEL